MGRVEVLAALRAAGVTLTAAARNIIAHPRKRQSVPRTWEEPLSE